MESHKCIHVTEYVVDFHHLNEVGNTAEGLCLEALSMMEWSH